MAIFNEELPKSEFYIPPDYETSPAKRIALAALGYNSRGQENFFGKIKSWIPGSSLLENAYASQIASGDTKKNIEDNFGERMSKAQMGIGVGKALLSGGTSLGGSLGGSTDTSKLAEPSLTDKQAVNSANAAFGIPITFQGVNPNPKTSNPTQQTVNPLSQTTNTQNGVASSTKSQFDPSSLLSGDIIGGLAGLMQKKKMNMGQSNIYLNY